MRWGVTGATSALFATQALQAQQLAQGSGVEISPWRVIGALLFCLALAAGALFALRNRLPRSGPFFRAPDGERMRVIEQLALGPQRQLYLVRIDDREFIAAFSPQGLSLTPLGKVPEPNGTEAA